MNRILTRRAPRAAVAAALALFVLCFLPAPGRSESLVDKESLAAFGGTYLSDCGNLESPRVEVTERTITYINRDMRIVSSNLRPAPQLHGTQMPAHFRGAIVSDTDEGEVRALLFEDTAGAWIELRGENPDLGALADPATTTRFLRCNEADLAARRPTARLSGAQSSLRSARAFDRSRGSFTTATSRREGSRPEVARGLLSTIAPSSAVVSTVTRDDTPVFCATAFSIRVPWSRLSIARTENSRLPLLSRVFTPP